MKNKMVNQALLTLAMTAVGSLVAVAILNRSAAANKLVTGK